jgi:hypothetical protein
MGSLSLWVFGVWCMLYAAAPALTTPEQRHEYSAILAKADNIPGMDEQMHRCGTAQ